VRVLVIRAGKQETGRSPHGIDHSRFLRVAGELHIPVDPAREGEQAAVIEPCKCKRPKEIVLPKLLTPTGDPPGIRVVKGKGNSHERLSI